MRARYVALRLAVAALTVGLARPVAAQDIADRPFVDSLLASIGNATSIATIPPVSRCAARSSQLRLLCDALITLRRNDFVSSATDIGHARDLFERSVEERPTWPVAWYGLGLVRLRLVRAGMMSREGPLAPIGVSDETTASNALVRALELDSTFGAAALALAAAPMGREGATRLANRLAMLQRRRALLDGPGLLAAGLVEREAGHTDAAVQYFRDALRRGDVDSGLVELTMARDLYRAGIPEEGRAMLLAGAADTTLAARHAYRREFEWVATPGELKTWDSLPPAARPDWLADFWARRDVRDGRLPGSRLIEHYRRIEFAFNDYRLTLPQTGRQKAAGVAQTVDMAALDYANFIARHDATIGDTSSANIVGDALIRLDDTRSTNSGSPFKMFSAPQDLIDDRGVIYIRQGPPDASAHTSRGEALELWVYYRPDGPLILSFREVNFDGQAGASQLVPTLLTENPLLRDELCHLKTSLCSTVADPRTPTLTAGAAVGGRRQVKVSNGADLQREQQRLNSGAQLKLETEEGKQAIAIATTTDAFPLRFSRAVSPAVQIYGLDRATGGAPRVIATFAIPGQELAGANLVEAGGRTVYPLRIQLLAANRGNGKAYRLDTLRRFATARALGPGEFLSGYVELALPPGRYATSLTISQEDGRGAIANLGEVSLPAAGGGLAVSNVVVGRDSSGVRWNSGATDVAFNPLNTFRIGSVASVYFQLVGLAPGVPYDTRFEFYRATDDSLRTPRLVIAAPMQSSGSRMEVSRSLGLKTLDPGRYRLRLIVRARDGTEAAATAWVNIVK